MRLSGGTGQPAKSRRQKTGRSAQHTKFGAPARGRRPSIAELQDELNALRRELSEAREQQTATAGVLKVISQSTFQLQPVFDTIVQTARRLCDAEWAGLHTLREGKYYLAAADNATDAFIKHASEHPIPPGRGSLIGRTAVEGATVHIPDCLADPEYTFLDYQAIGRYRSMLGVPLLRQGVVIGVIGLVRTTVVPFAEKQIDLIKTFADQAVVAIENVRLFEAEQQRTRDLSVALQQQTATADVLKVISRSTFDLPTVLDALVRSAGSLCEADMAAVLRPQDDKFIFAASFGLPQAFVDLVKEMPIQAGRGTLTGRVMTERRPVHIPDVLADPAYSLSEAQKAAGFRSMLGVPLLRKGIPIGIIILMRSHVRPFTDNQIDLVQTFADQAVIAIENVRLFQAEQERTHELTESLQQQTATADVLKVISRSTVDLQTVLNALIESATRLCGATRGHIFQFDGEVLRFAAAHGAWPGFKDYLESHALRPGKGSVAQRAALERRTCHVHDVLSEPGYEHSDLLKQQGYRTVLAVPMLRKEELLGVITILRTQVEPFTDKQIELVSTFADQAVIAIENTRLLSELREALRQQTATADVLKIISRSAFDLSTVLQTLVESAARLCEADLGHIARPNESGFFQTQAQFNFSTELKEELERIPLKPGHDSITGRALLERTTVQIVDAQNDPEYKLSKALTIGGYRTFLGVPLLREGSPIGVISLARKTVAPFTDRQIELASTFADQAVIAIENVRLFEAEQRRTRELSEALERQTATAEVLNVISRSTFQLQPVLDTIVQTASRLCNAETALIFMFRDENLHLVATSNASSAFVQHALEHPLPPGRGSIAGRTFLERQTVHLPDCLADPEYTLRDFQAIGQHRSMLGVPLLREGSPIGVITLWRTVVLPFTNSEIDLVKTFADQAVIAIENVRLFEAEQDRTRELTESLQQQTATADVLAVISSSQAQLKPVFETIVNRTTHICGASFACLGLFEGEALRFAAISGASAGSEFFHPEKLHQPDGCPYVVPLARAQKTVQTLDVRAEKGYLERDPFYVTTADVGGARTVLRVPLLKDGMPLGHLWAFRQEVQPFSDKQIALLENFAAQAVIALENTRLLNELRESLQQQIATADVLKIISSSPGELQPVFAAMLAKATDLCAASYGAMWLREQDGYRAVAIHGDLPQDYIQQWRYGPIYRPGSDVPLRRAIETRQPVQILDMRESASYLARDPGPVSAVEIAGVRTLVAVPMLKDDEPIGAIVIYRKEVRPFTDKQIELATTFADQAVIAIENTRLLNELRESLQQQTATADVLKVISRSTFDLQVVLDTLVKSAVQLCEADIGHIARPNEAGFFQTQAHFGFSMELKEELERTPFKPDRGSVTSRALLERTTVQIVDAQIDPEYKLSKAQKLGGYRSMIATPLLREGTPIGVLGLARCSVRPFTDKQMALLTTFADQAVIAIENARLFDEVRGRTDELAEALRQQTATADVLQVISRSAFDLQPVFDTVAESSVQLCEAEKAFIFRYDGESLPLVAAFNCPPDFKEWMVQHPIRLGRQSCAGRAALERRTVHIPDCQIDPEYTYGAKDVEPVRTILGVPILKGDELLGVIIIYRLEIRPFTDKQIALVETFADQAAIAIENLRLFNEVRARTDELSEALRQQTATADVLKVISRSAFDLPTVLQTLVESASRLCEADKAAIIRRKSAALQITEAYGFSQEFMEAVKDLPIEPTLGTASGRALLEGRTVHIPDVEADPDYTFTAKKLGDYRTILTVPMLREGEAIGVLVLTRPDVRPFTDKQIETVSTFADQAAIAIENVRLFESVEARTRELATSLEELRTAQDRLVQTEKLASLGQLTAGIAHEIKNPLNFVNNFSALAIELIGELQETLQAARLDGEASAQIAELSDMLKGNLGKVVEHGKRADSIVKNMLLHSRQEAGEHRPVEINALVAESLNLAYHGARAAKQGFNITLEQSLDPAAGIVDVFPQEITRVLLNLISNGFYAATKRKAEANSGAYEPTLTATTKNLGDSVEIRIRDNGTGIPAEVRDKLFNPFFTTKPPGEGTGLGLSLSYDIIVKQHGGSIEVDTQPGEFTEFTIVLPRSAASVAQPGDRR